jgi:predicted regulator of Ras-like GTPase activity (Roadblock/LC7/MglB family)
METSGGRQATLRQLAAVPGVVGSLIFDQAGAVTHFEFPASFDQEGLRQAAVQLAGDPSFREWLVGDQATMELRFVDGHVVVRALGGSWLLVLCTLQANLQRLALALRAPG